MRNEEEKKEGMIYLTAGEIEIIITGMSLGRILNKPHLTSKLSTKLARIIIILQAEFKLNQEEKRKISERYADKDDKGDPIIGEDKNFKFSPLAEYKALREIEEYMKAPALPNEVYPEMVKVRVDLSKFKNSYKDKDGQLQLVFTALDMVALNGIIEFIGESPDEDAQDKPEKVH